MRDVSHKIRTLRVATAQARIQMSAPTLSRIRAGDLPKGDPIPIARVAAVQAAKNTSQIIPYCHPLPIDHVDVAFEFAVERIEVRVTVKAIYKTGVEMEALTAASVAALTIYDMAKMIDQDLEIENVTLLSKEGGKSDWTIDHGWGRAAVVVVSDSVAAGAAQDRSGQRLVDELAACGAEVAPLEVLADEPDKVAALLKRLADDDQVDVVITTGGTGLGPRDTTPEAVARVIDRPISSLSDAIRAYGQERNPRAMLSRGVAGVRGTTLIVALPGSTAAVVDAAAVLMPVLPHIVQVLGGARHG